MEWPASSWVLRNRQYAWHFRDDDDDDDDNDDKDDNKNNHTSI
jgi:hypothetical protein